MPKNNTVDIHERSDYWIMVINNQIPFIVAVDDNMREDTSKLRTNDDLLNFVKKELRNKIALYNDLKKSPIAIKWFYASQRSRDGITIDASGHVDDWSITVNE